MTSPEFRRRLSELYQTLGPDALHAQTAAARAGLQASDERAVDPDRVLDPNERARRVAERRRARLSAAGRKGAQRRWEIARQQVAAAPANEGGDAA